MQFEINITSHGLKVILTNLAGKSVVVSLKVKEREDVIVTLAETESIVENLAGPKELRLYPQAGHESILVKYRSEWVDNVGRFIEENIPGPTAQ